MQKNCSTYCKSILEIGGGQRARGHDSWAPVNVSRARPTVESRCVGCRSITFNSRAPREPICVVRTILLLLISKSNLFTVHRGMPSREDREYLGGLSHNSRSIDNCPLTLHTCTITRNATLTCNIHDSVDFQSANVTGPMNILRMLKKKTSNWTHKVLTMSYFFNSDLVPVPHKKISTVLNM